MTTTTEPRILHAVKPQRAAHGYVHAIETGADATLCDGQKHAPIYNPRTWVVTAAAVTCPHCKRLGRPDDTWSMSAPPTATVLAPAPQPAPIPGNKPVTCRRESDGTWLYTCCHAERMLLTADRHWTAEHAGAVRYDPRAAERALLPSKKGWEL